MSKTQTKDRDDLLNLSMWRLFKKLAVPGMIGMVIVGLYNLMDGIFAGQFIGEYAVAAISLVYIIVLFNHALLSLIGGGSMSILSIAIGRKDQKTVDKILGNLVILIVLFSGVLSVVVYFNASWIVYFIGGRGEILALAVRYVRILSFGMIFAALGPAMNFLIRGEGRIKIAMIYLAIAGIINIILNPIFILVLGMGIEGAAIATVISQVILVSIQVVYFAKGKGFIAIKRTKLRLETSILGKTFKIGMGQLIIILMGAFQQVLIFRGLQRLGGDEHVILMGATYRLFTFAFIAIWGLGQGLQPLVGMNYGAKNYQRVIKAFRSFSIYGLVITVPLWLFFMIFPELALGLFITDSALVGQGTHYFRVFFSIFFSYIFFATSMALFIGLGKAKEAAIVAIARQVIFFVPLFFILSNTVGVLGVWIAVPLADALTIVLAFVMLFGFFKKGEFKKGSIDVKLENKV